MKDWFANLESRERLVVIGGGVFIMIALIYSLAWMPFDKQHRQLATSVANWERSLAELRPLRSIVLANARGAPRPAVAAQQAPIIVVDQTLRGRGLEQYRRRSQPTSTNGVRVELEGIPFDDLVLWLGDLSAEYGMHVQAGSLSAISQAGPGRINASLTLERAL
jgi:general secretion pathway protein M